MTPEEIIQRKNKTEDELCELKEEYQRIVEPCKNKTCPFYREEHQNKCGWTTWITECGDYIE